MSELGLSFLFVLFVFLLPVLFLAGLFLVLVFLALLGGPIVGLVSSPPQRIKLTRYLVYESAVLRKSRVADTCAVQLPAGGTVVRDEHG